LGLGALVALEKSHGEVRKQILVVEEREVEAFD
jgi:hypothetical protein